MPATTRRTPARSPPKSAKQAAEEGSLTLSMREGADERKGMPPGIGRVRRSAAFAEALHVGRPNIPNRERLFERLTAILDRRILTNNGPCVREFEEKLAEMLGVRHCVAVCNATIALQLAVPPCAFGRGDSAVVHLRGHRARVAWEG